MIEIMKRKVPFKEEDIPRYNDNLGINIINFVASLLRGIAYENMRSGSSANLCLPCLSVENICQATKIPKNGIIRLFVRPLRVRVGVLLMRKVAHCKQSPQKE